MTRPLKEPKIDVIERERNREKKSNIIMSRKEGKKDNKQQNTYIGIKICRVTSQSKKNSPCSNLKYQCLEASSFKVFQKVSHQDEERDL